MARLIFSENLPVYVEYGPVGLEKEVEDKLSKLGQFLGDAKARTGAIYTPTSAVESVGYDRGTLQPYKGLEIQYGRTISAHDSGGISIETFLERIRDENAVSQHLAFITANEDNIFISDDVQGIPEVWGNLKIEPLRYIREAILKKYEKLRIDSGDSDKYPSVDLGALFHTALESLQSIR